MWTIVLMQMLSKPRPGRVREPDPVPRLAAARRRPVIEPTPIVQEWMWRPPVDAGVPMVDASIPMIDAGVPMPRQNQDVASDSGSEQNQAHAASQ